MKKVSIILTTYNRPEMLKKAVDSVFDQTYQDWELIVLDDNSSLPAQKEYLGQLMLKGDPRVIVVLEDTTAEERKATVRYATLVNLGLKVSTGDYISYLCDDDYYFPNRLQDMVNFFDAHPEASFVGGDQQLMNKVDGGRYELTQHQYRKQLKILENANCNVDHSSVMHKRECLEKVPKWDDRIGYWGSADGVFFEELGKAGYLMYPVGVLTDCHIYHDGSWTLRGNWEKLGTEQESEVHE